MVTGGEGTLRSAFASCAQTSSNLTSDGVSLGFVLTTDIPFSFGNLYIYGEKKYSNTEGKLRDAKVFNVSEERNVTER